MGVQHKSRLSQLVLLFFVGAISLSLLSPLQAYAAPPAKPDDESKSYIWYKAIEKCFADAFDYADGISLDQVRSYDWFNDKSIAVGYLNPSDPGRGTADCNDKSMIGSAMSFWGYSDPVAAFCRVMRDAGAKRIDGSDCVSGSGNFTAMSNGIERATQFKRTIENEFYKAGGEPQLSPKAKYYLNFRTLVDLCHAKPVAKLDGASDTDKAILNSDKGYQIRWVNPETKNVEDWIFQGTGDETRESRVSAFEDESKGGYPYCREAALWLGDGSDQFLAYAKNSGFAIPGAPLAPNDPNNPDNPDNENETKTTCGVKGGLGWVVCPVMQFIAQMVDTMYSFIEDQLTVPIKMIDMTSGTYKAWSVFRDYANIAFIIAFLFIVYSQVTSVGISNYGIKKMLPKLIIGAILVNTSFFICQFAVDLTNLLGQGIDQLFSGIAGNISSNPTIGATGSNGEGGMGNIIAGVIVGGVVLVVALALGLLGPILLAVALVFFILLLRKVLIVVLIAIAPLAFVAYLLPNTEKWFKKWSDMFLKVLMVFPIVAIVVGGSKVASAIIAEQTSGTTTTLAAGSEEAVNGIIAAAVLTVPFFVIPGLLSKSLEAMGSFGKKLSGMSQKANSKVGKTAVSTAKKRYENSTMGRNRAIKANAKKQYRTQQYANRMNKTGLARVTDPRAWMKGKNPFAMSGGSVYAEEQLGRSAQAIADEGFEKEVKAASLQYATMSSGDVIKNALFDSNGGLNKGLSEAQRAAAIDRVMSSGSFAERRQLVEATSQMSAGEKARVSKGVYAKGDQNIFGSGIGSQIQGAGVKGADDLRRTTLKNIQDGHVNAEHLVQGEGSADYMVDVAKGQTDGVDAAGNKIKVAHGSVTGNTAAVQQLQNAHVQAQQNSSTKAKAAGGAMSNTLNRL